MLSLRPYQEQAADFLYEHDRALVLLKHLREPLVKAMSASAKALLRAATLGWPGPPMPPTPRAA